MSEAFALLLFDNRERSNGGTAAALYQQWRSVEHELSLVDQLFQVDEPLPMEDAAIPADPVAREEIVAWHIRRRTLDAVGLRATVSEPVGCLGSETRIAPYHLGVRIMTLVQPGVQQNDVPVDPDTRLLLSGLEIFHTDLTQVRYVRQFETYRLAEKHLERHLVYGGAIGVGVVEGVHMGPYVVEHPQEVGREGHPVLGNAKTKILR